MELNLRTVLVILGALVMLGILIDGFRRMRRARQDALKLDVKGDFQFPEECFSSELPNGGARVIGERDADEVLEEVQHFHEQLEDIPGMSALDQIEDADRHNLSADVQESLHEERIYAGEPDFQHDSYGNGQTESNEQDSIATNTPEHELESDVNSTEENQYEPAQIDDVQAGNTYGETDHKEARQEAAFHEEKQPASEHLVPKAKPLNLDEHVPLLMDVEELGEEVAPQEKFDGQQNLEHKEPALSPDDETIVLSTDDIPAIEASVSGIADILAPEENIETITEHEVVDNSASDGRQQAEDMMAIAAYTPVKKPGANAECLAERPVPNLVVVTHVVPHDEDGFCGEDILYLVNSCDLRHGEKDIFHRFEKEDGEGRVQFSMANSFNPGTFNPETLLRERIHGVSLFMSLPGPDKAMDAFEAMTEMASVIARNLGGDVHDETHSIMALQTIEHNRQQVRDFVRKQKLMGKK